MTTAPFATLWPLLEQAPFAIAVRQSSWMFPTLESIHVLAVVLVVGTISIVDLRLLGLPTREKAVRRITQEVLPYTWGFFVLALVTGFLMFASSATTYAADLPFQLKMVLMLLATPGMMAPAATATNPAIKAYSMRSCPRVSFQMRSFQTKLVIRVMSKFPLPCNSLVCVAV